MYTLFLFLMVVVSFGFSLVFFLYEAMTLKINQTPAKSFCVVGGILSGLFVLLLLWQRGAMVISFSTIALTNVEQIRGMLLTWSQRLKNYKHYRPYNGGAPIGRTSHSVIYNTGITGDVDMTISCGKSTLSGVFHLVDFKPHRLVDKPYAIGDMKPIDARARDTEPEKDKGQKTSLYELRWSTMPSQLLLVEAGYILAYLHLKSLTGQLGSIESNMRGFSWRFFGMRLPNTIHSIDDGFRKFKGDVSTTLLKASFVQYCRTIKLAMSIDGKPPVSFEARQAKEESIPDLSAFMVFAEEEDQVEGVEVVE